MRFLRHGSAPAGGPARRDAQLRVHAGHADLRAQLGAAGLDPLTRTPWTGSCTGSLPSTPTCTPWRRTGETTKPRPPSGDRGSRWCPLQESNLRPSAPEADALSPELLGLGVLDEVYQPSRDGLIPDELREVVVDLGHGGGGVAVRDGLDQRVVRRVVADGVLEVEPDVRLDGVQQVVVQRTEHGVTGGVGDRAVEGQVGLDHRVDVTAGVRRRPLVAQDAQLVDVRVGAA